MSECPECGHETTDVDLDGGLTVHECDNPDCVLNTGQDVIWVASYGSSEFGMEDMAVFSTEEDADDWVQENYPEHAPWRWTDVSPHPLDPPLGHSIRS